MLVICYRAHDLQIVEKKPASVTYEIFGYLHVDRLVQRAEDGADLAHTVRAVIEQEQRIVICACVRQTRSVNLSEGPRTFNPPSVPIHDNRLQKLIRLVLLIPRFDRGYIIAVLAGRLAFPVHEPFNRDLHALPALVAVHRIVPPHDGRDLAYAELFKEFT
jgi:hypothetical protein